MALFIAFAEFVAVGIALLLALAVLVAIVDIQLRGIRLAALRHYRASRRHVRGCKRVRTPRIYQLIDSPN